jgi:hypothetical protein
LTNRRVRFLQFRPESESRFSPYLIRIIRFIERVVSSRLYICRSQTIITSFLQIQSINRSFIFFRVRVNVAHLLPQIPLPPVTHLRHH